MKSFVLCAASGAWFSFSPWALATPAAAPSPGNEDCLACHEDVQLTASNGRSIVVAAKVFADSAHGPMACTDCHADLAHAEFPHAERLARVDCATCHADPVTAYGKSVHAAARTAGNKSAARCVDCHGMHDIRSSQDKSSPTYPLNLPNMCGRCHGDAKIIKDGGIQALYASGIHGSKLASGDSRVPVCSDCHTAHEIRRVDADAWKLDVLAECGSCHEQSLATYRDTFHGQVTNLGIARVASCSDCHGAHDVYPKADPRSSVSPANRAATCAKCHPAATASFAGYDPHADKHDAERNPPLYWTARFMELLLAGVFVFFGLHTSLWFQRLLRKDPPAPKKKQAGE